MMAVILNSAVLDSAILHKKKNFTHSFWLNLMMAVILKFGHVGFRHCHLGFRHLVIFISDLTQLEHSHSIIELWHLGLIQSALKLIDSHLTWWWQSYWIWPSWIQPFPQKKLPSCILTQIDDGSHLEFCHLGFSQFPQKNFTQVHSHSNW